MSRLITQTDLDGFAELSGDFNPIHVDPQYAADTPFQAPVAHGMFLVSLVSAELGRRWPRHVISDFSVMFPTPTPVGTRVEIDIHPGEALGEGLSVNVEVRKLDGDAGLQGEFLLKSGEPR